jgi:predicted esterase
MTGSTTSSGSSGSTGSGSAGSGGSDAGPAVETMPQAANIPKAQGACPEFTQGSVAFTNNGSTRNFLIWVDPTKATPKGGPLVFYWHGAGGDPSEAPDALGPALTGVTALGGVVAAAYHDPANTLLPWDLTLGGTDETDLQFADQVLACAIEKVGVDLRRIHSVGFSAGAMNTEQFAERRSGYLASIVAYSGALIGSVTEEDPANLYPAMLYDGGPTDMVIVNFQQQTAAFHQLLQSEGHFSFICDHDMGHTIPSAGPAASWQFLQDHPFGTIPDPYAKALPASFPKYCTL